MNIPALSVTTPKQAAELEEEDDDVGAQLACRGCCAPLDLSQPDPQRPEALLGICSECGLWHQIQIQTLGVVAG